MTTRNFFFLIITLAACLGQFASDIYTPSVPAIAHALHGSLNLAQWSMAIYMLGMACAQLVFGPLSEGLGRKKALLMGLFIMVVGSIVCASAHSMSTLIAGRLIQGIGGGAIASLWRAIFRDKYSGDELAKLTSYLVIIIVFVVPAAPAVGGYLQHFAGWRSSFIFLLVYTVLVMLCISLFYKETSQHHHITRLKPSFIGSKFKEMLSHRLFMSVSICTFLTYGSFFAWFAASPILLIHLGHMSPVAYGWINFLGGGAAYASAGLSNARLVNRFGRTRMMRFGWFTVMGSGVLMILGYVIFGINIWAIMIPAVLMYFGSTFIWPNAYATAFTPFGHIAGYAGALYGFMQTAGGAVLGSLVSYLPEHNQIPLGCVFIAAGLVAWLVFESVAKKHME